MSDVVIEAVERNTGKQHAKALRRKGMVPGIVYGEGKEGIPIAVREQSLWPLVYTQHFHTVTLKIDGQPDQTCILKDFQLDPITDRIVHFDFQLLTEGHKITVEVPVTLVGEAPGTKVGGILQQAVSKLEIECLPTNIPDHIEIDISELKIGDSISVADLTLPNIEILNDPEEVIVTIIAPAKEAEVSGAEESEGETQQGTATASE